MRWGAHPHRFVTTYHHRPRSKPACTPVHPHVGLQAAGAPWGQAPPHGRGLAGGAVGRRRPSPAVRGGWGPLLARFLACEVQAGVAGAWAEGRWGEPRHSRSAGARRSFPPVPASPQRQRLPPRGTPGDSPTAGAARGASEGVRRPDFFLSSAWGASQGGVPPPSQKIKTTPSKAAGTGTRARPAAEQQGQRAPGTDKPGTDKPGT